MSNTVAVTDLFRNLRKNYYLLMAITKREVMDRYQGQILGPIWYFGHPLLLMAVYIFIFSIVLHTRPQLTPGMSYVCYILAGLIAWIPTVETLSRSATLLQSHSHVVKNIVFPVEILPMKVVLVSMLPMFVTLTVFFGYEYAQTAFLGYVYPASGSFSPLLLILPFLILLHGLFLVGMSFLISSVGVFLKDMKDVLQVFLTVATYIMPIFYLPDQVPSVFRPVLYFNPFSHLIWCYQDVLVYGRFEHAWSWLIFPLLTLLLLWKSHDLFFRLRSYFGHVL